MEARLYCRLRRFVAKGSRDDALEVRYKGGWSCYERGNIHRLSAAMCAAGTVNHLFDVAHC